MKAHLLLFNVQNTNICNTNVYVILYPNNYIYIVNCNDILDVLNRCSLHYNVYLRSYVSCSALIYIFQLAYITAIQLRTDNIYFGFRKKVYKIPFP